MANWPTSRLLEQKFVPCTSLKPGSPLAYQPSLSQEIYLETCWCALPLCWGNLPTSFTSTNVLMRRCARSVVQSVENRKIKLYQVFFYLWSKVFSPKSYQIKVRLKSNFSSERWKLQNLPPLCFSKIKGNQAGKPTPHLPLICRQ